MTAVLVAIAVAVIAITLYVILAVLWQLDPVEGLGDAHDWFEWEDEVTR